MLRVCGLLTIALSASLPSWSQIGRPSAGSAASIEIITRTIDDCEDRTDKFVRSLRRAMNWSSLDGTAREDELQRVSRDLEKSMDRVKKAWTRKKDVSETRRHVDEAIRSARNVNVTMRARRLDPGVERDWMEVRGQLNLLARAFKLPSIPW
jgi:hypothetical protein